MSRQNKANRNNYTQAGRLTPDESARERQKQVRGATRELVKDSSKDAPASRAGRESTRRRTASEE